MPLSVGSRLGHYDVTALIGEGGMGQVYQATDAKLDRKVALKVLAEAFTADTDRLDRYFSFRVVRRRWRIVRGTSCMPSGSDLCF